MRLPWTRGMTRAEAVMLAIDTSDPGDSIDIHEDHCTDPRVCCCTPLTIYVGGESGRHPIGFRMRKVS